MNFRWIGGGCDNMVHNWLNPQVIKRLAYRAV